MASTIFTKAKAYRKAHPKVSYQEAIQIVSGKKTVKKKSAIGKKPVKKIIVKVGATRSKPKKEHHSKTKISGIAKSAYDEQHKKVCQYEDKYDRLSGVSVRGMSAKEKAEHMREKKNARQLISDAKKYLRSLKRAM